MCVAVELYACGETLSKSNSFRYLWEMVVLVCVGIVREERRVCGCVVVVVVVVMVMVVVVVVVMVMVVVVEVEVEGGKVCRMLGIVMVEEKRVVGGRGCLID